MSIEKLKEYFKEFNLEDRIKEFSVSSATVELAAKALGCEPGHIAKSLAFMVNNKPTLIVVAGNVKISNSKFKQQFNTKAKMLSYEETENLIGYKVGGVCPFLVKENVDIYLDISLKKYDKIYPACGTNQSAIELTISELEQTTNYIDWIDIAQETIES